MRHAPAVRRDRGRGAALPPGNRGAGLGEWVTTLTLTQIYFDDLCPSLTQMWSLCTEVAFYVVLPVLMWLGLSRARGRGRRGDRLGLLALAMAATTVVWLMDLSVRWDGGGTMMRLWLPSYLVWFAVGILLASYDVRSREGRGAATDRLTAVVQELVAPPACAGWPREHSSSSPPPRWRDRPTSRRPRSAPR